LVNELLNVGGLYIKGVIRGSGFPRSCNEATPNYTGKIKLFHPFLEIPLKAEAVGDSAARRLEELLLPSITGVTYEVKLNGVP
jgi:hypothetical protein